MLTAQHVEILMDNLRSSINTELTAQHHCLEPRLAMELEDSVLLPEFTSAVSYLLIDLVDEYIRE